MAKLLFDNVLIEEYKEESAVVSVGDSRKTAIKGIVIEAGPGQAHGLPKFEPTTVKKGDMVYFLQGMSYKIEIGGKKYRVVRERDVLCVL